jgi:hypothetical protein
MGDRSNWVLTVNSNDGDVQSPSNAWTTAVAYDSMGNAFTSGVYGAPPGGGSGMYLIKTDPNGQVMFNYYYDEIYAFGYSMIVDKNDDVVFVLAEFDPASADTVLVKVSGTDGTIMWQKYLADTDAASDDVALCLDIDPNNNVIIAGTTATSSQYDFWVGKFNGETGAPIWQRQYDSNGCRDAAGGIAIDSDGNIGVVGTSYGPGTFLGVFKVAGSNGDVIWQKRVVNASSQGEEDDGLGRAWVNGELYSSDICVDSNNDFYFNLTGMYCSAWAVAGIHKITGAGDWKWSKVISYSNFLQGSSSLTCDSNNNVYLTTTLGSGQLINQMSGSYGINLVMTKFNAAGRKIWGKSLRREQSQSFAGGGGGQGGDLIGVGQTVAVNDDYILVGGGYAVSYPYGEYGFDNDWYQQPFLAQLDKSGTDFVNNGWIFKDAEYKIFTMTLSTDDDNWLNDLSQGTPDIVVSTGEVTFKENSDTYNLAHINVSRVKTMTLDGARLHLPENGGLEFSRKHTGHITSIGKFDLDGNEGNNTGGATWINGVTGGADGDVYAVGGWYTYNNWNDGDSNVEVPLVWKIDSEGAIVWSAGNNLSQWGADMVDVAFNAADNTILALGHDNENYLNNIDGAEGFNLFTLDAGSGTLKSVQHVRPDSTPGNPDMTPFAIALKSDGTPVVVGYMNNNYDEFNNVTGGGAGLPGSGAGILVINKSVFDRQDDKVDVVYPNGLGYWYIGGSAISYVNRYASVASVNTTVAGTGAKFDVVTTSGTPGTATVTVNGGNAGSGYKVGNYFVVLGENIGGATAANNILFQVATINGSGGILTVNTVAWSDSGYTSWGTFNDVTKELQVGHDATFTVIADPVTREYSVSTSNTGTAYSAGDTVKVLGSLLGGVDGVNDAIITITSAPNGEIDTIDTITGLGQATTIKLDVGTGTDFTQAGTYNVWHETDGDAFIWTPDWHVAFGGEANWDSAQSLVVDSDDNIIIGGSSDNLDLPPNTTQWNNSGQTAYIAKYSSAGERLWAKAVDGHEGNNVVWGVVTDTDNNIYGVMGAGPSSYDPSVIKLDSDGNFVWMVQLDYYSGWQSTLSIAIDADQNIIISSDQESNLTETDRVGYQNNIHLAKFDRDGNALWKRLLWTNNGMYTGYNDWYGNNLAIVGDKFVFGGVANAWNDDDNDIAVVAQLPVDGSSPVNMGNYYYDTIEIYVERWTDNSVFGPGKQIVRDVQSKLPTRELALIEEPYGTGQDAGNPQDQDGGDFQGATGPLSIYANLDGKVEHVLEEGGADITGVKEIVFEDGTRQSTSSQDIPQVDISITNRGNDSYVLRLEDRGHHIYMQDGQGVDICIPNAYRVPFPVGTSIVIVTGASSRTIYSDDNDDYMYLAGSDGDASYSWTIPRWSMATLLKIFQGHDNDGTPNGDGEWMIAGPGITN